MVSASAALVLSGCTLLDGKQRELNVADGTGVSLDITRRAVIAVPEYNGDGELIGVRTCAEPSPDAMTTLAAQIAGNVTTPEGINAEIAGNLSENGAFVGLRTQSIQLLRDAMYRSCEAYLSDGISEDTYELLLKRHQRFMLGLLSIEAITGTVKAPSVTISTQSLAAAARSLSSLREDLTTVEEEITERTERIAELEARRNANPKAADYKQAEEDAEAKKLEQEKKSLEAQQSSLTDAIKSTSGLLATGQTQVEVSNVGLTVGRSDAHIAAVSNSVVEITRLLIENTDDVGAYCLTALSKGKNSDANRGGIESSAYGTVLELCERHLGGDLSKTATVRENPVDRLLERLADPKISAAERISVMSLLDTLLTDRSANSYRLERGANSPFEF